MGERYWQKLPPLDEVRNQLHYSKDIRLLENVTLSADVPMEVDLGLGIAARIFITSKELGSYFPLIKNRFVS